MKCQILFSGKNKKNISNHHLLKFFPACIVLNFRICMSRNYDVKGCRIIMICTVVRCRIEINQEIKMICGVIDQCLSAAYLKNQIIIIIFVFLFPASIL